MDKKPYHHLSDGTFREPERSPVRFKVSVEKYGFSKEDAIIFKLGEITLLIKSTNYFIIFTFSILIVIFIIK